MATGDILGISACVESASAKLFEFSRKVITSASDAVTAALGISTFKKNLENAMKVVLPDVPPTMANFATELLALKSVTAEQFLARSTEFITRWAQAVPGVRDIVKSIQTFNICSVSNVYAGTEANGIVTVARVQAFATQMSGGVLPELPEELGPIKGDDRLPEFGETLDQYKSFMYQMRVLIQGTRPKPASVTVKEASSAASLAEAASLKGMATPQYVKEFGNKIDPAIIQSFFDATESSYAAEQSKTLVSSLATIAGAYKSKIGLRVDQPPLSQAFRDEYDDAIQILRGSLTGTEAIAALDSVSVALGDLIQSNALVIRAQYQMDAGGPAPGDGGDDTNLSAIEGEGVLPPKDPADNTLAGDEPSPTGDEAFLPDARTP